VGLCGVAAARTVAALQEELGGAERGRTGRQQENPGKGEQIEENRTLLG
jgi:hypothetical protein